MHRIVAIACTGIAVGLIMSLSGCATGERMTADGKLEHQLFCGGLLPWSVCDGKAAEVCPAGYQVVSKEWDAMSGSTMWIRCTPAKVAVGS